MKQAKNNNLVVFSGSTSKHAMNANCTLSLTSKTEDKKKEINAKVKTLVNKHMDNPEQLLRHLILKGLTVYKLPKAEKILAKLGEEEGFLTPLKGFKALYLNFIIGLVLYKKPIFKFTTKEMFIFDKGSTEIYTIARAIHKYYGFKNNLPGYDYNTQEKFKKVYRLSKNSNYNFSDCTIKDFYACKEALSRDLESINFSIELSVEYERSKKALNKLKETNCTTV